MEYLSVGIGLLRLVLDLNTPDAQPMVFDEWVHGKGDYVIHSEITEAEACRKAESRAKLNAIQSFSGEYVSSDTFMSCQEKGDTVNCPIHTFTWAMWDGLIRGIRDRTVRVTENLQDQRVCRVILEARVTSRSEPSDPNFDVRVDLSNPLLRDGDPLVITVDPTQEMFVNILLEEHENKLTLIFPNEFDLDSKITGRTPIPIGDKYSIVARFPADLSGNEIEEVIHVLTTPQKLALLEEYSIEDFNLKLMEIPNNQKRYVRKAYRLVR